MSVVGVGLRQMAAWRTGGAEIWVVDAAAGPLAAQLSALLDDEERARAACFRHDVDRLGYVRAHGALRCVLGDLLGVRPERLRFGRTDMGKPFVRRPGAETVEFSLSHSRDLALVAVSRVGPVGIDVEVGPPPDELTQHVLKYFTAEEASWLADLPMPERGRRLLEVWTRKEAYLKAIGTGLSGELSACRCRLDPDGQVSAELDPRGGRHWVAVGLDGLGDAVGSVVFEDGAAPSRPASRVFAWSSLGATLPGFAEALPG